MILPIKTAPPERQGIMGFDAFGTQVLKIVLDSAFFSRIAARTAVRHHVDDKRNRSQDDHQDTNFCAQGLLRFVGCGLFSPPLDDRSKGFKGLKHDRHRRQSPDSDNPFFRKFLAVAKKFALHCNVSVSTLSGRKYDGRTTQLGHREDSVRRVRFVGGRSSRCI